VIVIYEMTPRSDERVVANLNARNYIKLSASAYKDVTTYINCATGNVWAVEFKINIVLNCAAFPDINFVWPCNVPPVASYAGTNTRAQHPEEQLP
jgi:hypothetical protein